MAPDRFRKVPSRRVLRLQTSSQNLTRLLFHRPAVIGGAFAQLRFNAVIQPPYRDVCHQSMMSLQLLWGKPSACGGLAGRQFFPFS
jgi:hypothetical protein